MELLRAPTELCLSAAQLATYNSCLCHVFAPLLHLVLVNIPVLGLRKMSRFVLLLAASATALNLGVPVLRSTRPSLRRVRTGRFAQAPCCLTRTAT